MVDETSSATRASQSRRVIADSPGDPWWEAVETYLADVPHEADPVSELSYEIDAVGSLIAEHGTRRLK